MPPSVRSSTVLPALAILVTSWSLAVLAENDVPSAPPNRSGNNTKCLLSAQEGFREELKHVLVDSTTLVEMTIRLVNHPPDVLVKWMRGMYKPYLWVRLTGPRGRKLLRLSERYSFLSLSTLSVGVAKMGVAIQDTPPTCLKWLSPQQAVALIREALLTDFAHPDSGDQTGSLGKEERICNMHVVNDDGYADFRYQCCHKNQQGQTSCEDIGGSTDWIEVILTLIFIIKIIVLLYSPLLLPERLYRDKYKAGEYTYHVPDDPVTLKVVVTQDPLSYGEENKDKRVHLSDLHHMEYFKAMVSGNRWQQDKVYELKIQDCRLSVSLSKLLDRYKVPVGLATMLYNNLIKCQIRKLSPLRTCCNASILGNFSKSEDGEVAVTWSKCMQVFARYCLLLLLASPWFIRVAIFYNYEEDYMEERSRVAEDNGLSFGYHGNMVLYLTPLHGVFIVIYLVILLDSLVWGVLTKAMMEKFNRVTLQCLSDMRERSRIAVVSWLVSLLVVPFTVCGLVALIVFPVYLVVILVLTTPLIAFYLFPSLNFTVRLVVHIFLFACPTTIQSKISGWARKLVCVNQSLHVNDVTSKETFIRRNTYSTCGILLQLIVIVVCLISFWSVTLLLMEVISFFAEMLVYTFMGIIINADFTLPFVALVFLLLMYTKNCLARMSNVYLEYHKTVHETLLAMKQEEINRVAIQADTVQQNAAFNVVGEMTTVQPAYPKPLMVVKHHIPYWRASGLLVFLDSLDKPHTPTKFFHSVTDLSHFGCPGPVSMRLLTTMWELVKVAVYLLLVFITVLAFGDVYKVSSTNQLLAIVVGGLVPFLFRNFVKTRRHGASVNTNSVQFQTELHKSINCYQQSWPAYDIIPVSVREAGTPSLDGQEGKVDDPVPALSSALDGNGDAGKPTNVIQLPPLDGSDETRQDLKNDDQESSRSEKKPRSVVSGRSGSQDIQVETSVVSSHDAPLLSQSSSTLSMEDHLEEIDIIVDLSTFYTRSDSFLLKKRGLEAGSLTMLDMSRQRRPESDRVDESKGPEDIV